MSPISISLVAWRTVIVGQVNVVIHINFALEILHVLNRCQVSFTLPYTSVNGSFIKLLVRIFPKNSICYFHFKGKGCQKDGQQCRFTYCHMAGCSTKTKCCEEGLKCLDTRFGIARCKKEGTNFRNINKTYYIKRIQIIDYSVYIVPYWGKIVLNVFCIFFLQIYQRDYLILILLYTAIR